MLKNRLKEYCAITFSILLYYLVYPNQFSIFGFSQLAFVFAAPFFAALEAQSLKKRIGFGIIHGLFCHLLLFHWLIPISFKATFLLALVVSVQSIVFAAFYKTNFSKNFVSLLYLPALWVFSEFIRAFVMGKFVWSLGYAFAFYWPFVQISDVTGVYGISFITIFINTGIFMALKDRPKAPVYLGFVVLIFFLNISYGQISYYRGLARQTTADEYKICSVQPNISIEDKRQPSMIYELTDLQVRLSYHCLDAKKADLVVWPETAVTDDVLRNENINKKMLGLVKVLKTNTLVGSALLENERDKNSAVMFDKDGSVSRIYHKQRLIPFAEATITKKTFEPGENPGVFFFDKDKTQVGQNKFGVLICSEDFYPSLVRNLVRENAKFVVVMLNDGWFKTKEVLMMHAQASILQAASFKIPIIRSANTGLSAHIDMFGQRKDIKERRTYLHLRKVFKYHLSGNNYKTFYAQFGDIFAITCSLFVIMVMLKEILVRKKP